MQEQNILYTNSRRRDRHHWGMFFYQIVHQQIDIQNSFFPMKTDSIETISLFFMFLLEKSS